MFVGNIRRVFERALMAIRDPLSATPIFLGVSFVLTKRHFFLKKITEGQNAEKIGIKMNLIY